MALSDLTVRQAKAAGAAYTLGDIDGLSLNVSPNGGKSWHFRYCWAGKQKRISLGTYPEVSLRQARLARDEARSLLSKGVNPRVHRKQQKLAARQADEYTFRVVFMNWMERYQLEISTGKRSTHERIMRTFRKDVLPFLGKLPIHEIRRPDLLEVVGRVERRDALTTAQSIRGWLRQMFRYALVTVPGLEYNYATDLDVVAVPQRPARHNPFLRLAELPELLRALRNYPGKEETRAALRLLLLTGVRTAELRYATPEQFDLERGLWSVPPENVKQLQRKMRKAGGKLRDMPPYLVPLSTQAVGLVRDLLRNARPGQPYLLAHRNDPEKCVSVTTLNAGLRRLGFFGRLTAHGLRGTLSTALNEIGYPRAWVEAQLSHADPNPVRAAYNHADYVEQRRRMMQDWADRLDLFEQNQVERASRPLDLHPEGVTTMPALAEM
jgi:integrase